MAPAKPGLAAKVSKEKGAKGINYRLHFEYIGKGKAAQARCLYCSSVLSRNNGATNVLNYHLTHKHADKVKSLDDEIEEIKENVIVAEYVRCKITDYLPRINLKERTFEMYVSRLVAVDGISFRRLTESDILRDLLRCKFIAVDIPSSANTFRSIVMSYGEKIREEAKSMLKSYMEEGNFLSVVTDEWRSLRNRKYINVTVVGSGAFHCNLGLERIVGSPTAESCLKLLRVKLAKFNLDLDQHIVAIISDGASVMTKLGRDWAGRIHQLCQVHGINCAVQDVFYPRKNKKKDGPIAPTDGAAAADNGALESDAAATECDEDGFVLDEFASAEEIDITNEALKPIITKLRSFITSLRKSTVVNDTLTTYAKQEVGEELTLILDNKIRWNSLQDMLERAALLKNVIQKTAIDHKLSSKIPTDPDFQVIEEVSDVLAAVRSGMEAVCRRDIDLYTTDVTLQFLVDQLKEKGPTNSWSFQLLTQLLKRLKERRSPYSGVFAYLQTRQVVEDEDQDWEALSDFDLLPPLKRSELVSLLYDLIAPRTKNIESVTMNLELASGPPEPMESDSQELEPSTPEDTSDKTFTFRNKKQAYDLKLQSYLNKAKSSVPAKAAVECTQSDLKDLLRKEMHDFETRQELGTNLSKAFLMLSSVKPSSIYSEQSFSAAGQFVTKVRSSLGDDTLDTLCFLRGWFQQVPFLEKNDKKNVSV